MWSMHYSWLHFFHTFFLSLEVCQRSDLMVKEQCKHYNGLCHLVTLRESLRSPGLNVSLRLISCQCRPQMKGLGSCVLQLNREVLWLSGGHLFFCFFFFVLCFFRNAVTPQPCFCVWELPKRHTEKNSTKFGSFPFRE